MFYLTSSFISRRLLLLAALSALGSARACGPDFPNAYLTMSGSELTRLPTLDFSAELSRIRVESVAGETFSAVDEKAAAAREHAELREVLLAAGVPRDNLEHLAGYPRENPPRELPKEFQLYAEGAREWRDRNYGRALARWHEVLALPAAERRYRSVWAAYMLGRAQWDGDEKAAREAFAQTRELATQGFADSQGLAVASLGWEARTYLRQEYYPEAIRLYLRQHAAGDRQAALSLQLAIRAAFVADDLCTNRDDERMIGSPLMALARDQDLRGAVTAWFVSRGGPHMQWSAEAVQRFRRWIKALAMAAPLTPVEADRWAWAAYQNGLWDEAAKFAEVAPAGAAASEWVRAMLLMRQAKMPEAADHLAAAARSFQQDVALTSPAFDRDEWRFEDFREDAPVNRLGGVRGVLALQRSQYIEALRLFRQAGHWSDAAYVAEKVLTLDELTAFVRAETKVEPPAPPAVSDGDKEWRTGVSRSKSQDVDLRLLLARRLVRAGKFDQAREYFPADMLASYDCYVAAVRKGYDRVASRPERADALWTAAQLVEQHGMEWQGTELAPDYAITGGDYEWPEMIRASWKYGRTENYGAGSATLVSDDESRRIWLSAEPLRRFHYRLRATELAFLAATLLPDDDERTAVILNTAGRWISARYPQDAEIFYKTLVFRCPNTRLGKAAADRHWLVPLSDSSEVPSAETPLL